MNYVNMSLWIILISIKMILYNRMILHIWFIVVKCYDSYTNAIL